MMQRKLAGAMLVFQHNVQEATIRHGTLTEDMRATIDATVSHKSGYVNVRVGQVLEKAAGGLAATAPAWGGGGGG